MQHITNYYYGILAIILLTFMACSDSCNQLNNTVPTTIDCPVEFSIDYMENNGTGRRTNHPCPFPCSDAQSINLFSNNILVSRSDSSTYVPNCCPMSINYDNFIINDTQETRRVEFTIGGTNINVTKSGNKFIISIPSRYKGQTGTLKVLNGTKETVSRKVYIADTKCKKKPPYTIIIPELKLKALQKEQEALQKNLSNYRENLESKIFFSNKPKTQAIILDSIKTLIDQLDIQTREISDQSQVVDSTGVRMGRIGIGGIAGPRCPHDCPCPFPCLNIPAAWCCFELEPPNLGEGTRIINDGPLNNDFFLNKNGQAIKLNLKPQIKEGLYIYEFDRNQYPEINGYKIQP